MFFCVKNSKNVREESIDFLKKNTRKNLKFFFRLGLSYPGIGPKLLWLIPWSLWQEFTVLGVKKKHHFYVFF